MDEKIQEIKNHIEEELEEEFHISSDDDGVFLLGRNVIIGDLLEDEIQMILKSDLYPDDAAIVTLVMRDMADKFGYELKVGSPFYVGKSVFFGEEAINKMEEDMFDEARSDIEFEHFLDYKLYYDEGYDC